MDAREQHVARGVGRSRRCRCRGGRPSRARTRGEAELGDRRGGRDGDVVEQAEAHRPAPLRRGGRRDARRRSPTSRLAREQRAAPSRRRRPRRAGRPRRRPRPTNVSASIAPPPRGAQLADRAHVLGGVDELELRLARPPGRLRRSHPSQSRSASAALERDQPLGRVGMPGREHAAGRAPGRRGGCREAPASRRHAAPIVVHWRRTMAQTPRQGHDARDGLRGGRAAAARAPSCPVPAPGPGSCCCRSRPAASAAPTCTCSTARSTIAPPPRVLGHQIVGTRRSRAGEGLAERRRARRGRARRACRGSAGPCGECEYCTSGPREPLPAGALHRPRHRRRHRRVHGRRRALLLPAPRRATPTSRPPRCCAPG